MSGALALMDADGELVVPARQVVPGRLDAARVLPEIWEIRRTCYLQCLHDSRPVGSALVIQPLLSRPTMRTKQIVRPDGSTYTGIAGWGPPPRGEGADESEPQAAASAEPQRVFSGFRIYAERDVVLRTSLGDIVLAMRPDEAPNTVWNFRHLVDPSRRAVRDPVGRSHGRGRRRARLPAAHGARRPAA
jgi:hypothetical protein